MLYVAISILNSGNQLNQLVNKGLVVNQNRLGGSYSLAGKKVIHEFICSFCLLRLTFLGNMAGQTAIPLNRLHIGMSGCSEGCGGYRFRSWWFRVDAATREEVVRQRYHFLIVA